MTIPRFSFFSTLLPNMKDLSLGRFLVMTKSSNVFVISLMYSMILNLSKIDSMKRYRMALDGRSREP